MTREEGFNGDSKSLIKITSNEMNGRVKMYHTAQG